MLETQQLAIGYAGQVVASGIDIAVHAGEVLCLLGPNGAGKTTLFKTLLGLIPPVAGDVRLTGRPIAGLSRAEVARVAAYVPQAQHLAFSYSVFDIVLMGRTAHLGPFGGPRPIDRERAHAALADLGIAALADADVNRISGGQRQLCLIARALAQDARILMMDEPTASLDFGNRLLVLERVRSLRDRGYGVVVSTHDPDQARDLATRAAIIANGRLAAYGPPTDALSGRSLSAVYGVPITVERTENGRYVATASRGPA